MSYTPPVYPSSIPSTSDLPDRVDDVDDVLAERYNEIKKELVAALTELGTLPKGAFDSIKARLDDIDTSHTFKTPTLKGAGTTTGIAAKIQNNTPSDLLSIRDDGIVTLPLNSGAKAHLKADHQVISTGSWQKCQLTLEAYDIQGEFDNATNYRFTAKVDGYYEIKSNIIYADSVDQKLFLSKIYRNGSATNRTPTVIAASGTDILSVVNLDTIHLAANDYIELYTWQNSGGNRTIWGDSDLTFMAVNKIR